MIKHLVLIFCFVFPAVALAEYETLYPNFSTIEESKAYARLLKRREMTDQAKLHYLIDRFADSKIQIRYDDHLYPPALASHVARWFLSQRYKKQTPEEWVRQYCDKSIMSGKAIWVKLPDGTLKRSRDVLFNEIHGLERVLAREKL